MLAVGHEVEDENLHRRFLSAVEWCGGRTLAYPSGGGEGAMLAPVMKQTLGLGRGHKLGSPTKGVLQ
jgi:hypothetical protein